MLDAINEWALERVEYNFESPDFSLTTGYFTQIVWKATTEIGCAKRQCSEFCYGTNADQLTKETEIDDFANGKPSWYVVCQYQAPGNVKGPGFFEENVGRQTSGDPKVGIPGTLSSTPPTSTFPIHTAAQVATSTPDLVIIGAPDPLPEAIIITVTVTEGDALTEASAATAETGKTAEAPISTSGPFWGRLKSSGGTMDTSFFHVLRRRNGTARLEGNIFMVVVGFIVSMVLAVV